MGFKFSFTCDWKSHTCTCTCCYNSEEGIPFEEVYMYMVYVHVYHPIYYCQLLYKLL